MLDQALDALTTYDWGADPNSLNPIEDAIVASHGNADARLELEQRLAAILQSPAPRAAKDYACRKLMAIGTAASVPALAEILRDEELSHMARYALERIPAPEAGQALRDALPGLSPALQIGAIGSLGSRQDAESVAALSALLGDPAVAAAAASALGNIGGGEAAQALAEASLDGADAQRAVADASLACAEGLLAAGDKAQALAIFKKFVGEGQPKHVRVAATRGMLACAGQKQE